ncbi:MAG: substrate-binding domain-containing protein [Pseudomonadota bacterium]
MLSKPPFSLMSLILALRRLALTVLAAGSLGGISNFADARDEIQIAGSSTVLPFAIIVAEEYSLVNMNAAAPVVASGGTGGGFRVFCQGIGESTTDISNASRPIKDSERENCTRNGVTEIIEIEFGYDGIVLAAQLDQPAYELTTAHIWRALGAQVPVDGAWAANPYSRWNEIDPALPDREITLFIPGENHGTREVFELKVLMDGCMDEPLVQAMAKDEREGACYKLRTDGRSVDIAGDYSETIARINSSKTGIGVFGVSFFDQNRDTLRAATINGIEPTMAEIEAGRYPVFRPLYFYVKKAHIGVIDGLADYVELFLSEDMIGPDGLLIDAGLIPLEDNKRETMRDDFRAAAS